MHNMNNIMACKCFVTNCMQCLLIFAFVQIQLRWRQDESITRVVKWKAQTENVTQQTGARFMFQKTQFSNEMQLSLKITAPPHSNHRVIVDSMTIDVYIPPSGVAFYNSRQTFDLQKGFQCHHYYDGPTSEAASTSVSASAELLITFFIG